MAHRARNSLFPALSGQAAFWSTLVLLSVGPSAARGQNVPLPQYAKELSAMGVPILPPQPAPKGGGLPQNFPLANPSDPFHVFDQAAGPAESPAAANTTGTRPTRTATTAGAKVLVLKSGRVVPGKIRRDSHGYFVDSPRSNLYFPFSYVRFIAADLHEAHDKMCESIEGTSLHRDEVLGRWCLENDLRAEAADHFKKVLAAEPGNHEARHALARLDQDQSEDRGDDPEVRSRSTPADSQVPESLSRLSGSAVREFVTGIQPILLARCGGVKCHTGGKSAPLGSGSFRLEHARLSQSSRSATARNLNAVLGLLDSQFPSQSPLFQKGLQPHGGLVMRAPLSGPAGRSQEMRLRRWVDAISPERNRLRRDEATRTFVKRFNQSKTPPTLRDPNVVPASANADENDATAANSLSPPSDGPPAFRSPVSSPKQMGPASDPFDPGRFNSR